MAWPTIGVQVRFSDGVQKLVVVSMEEILITLAEGIYGEPPDSPHNRKWDMEAVNELLKPFRLAFVKTSDA
jgi:hypothetical protein